MPAVQSPWLEVHLFSLEQSQVAGEKRPHHQRIQEQDLEFEYRISTYTPGRPRPASSVHALCGPAICYRIR